MNSKYTGGFVEHLVCVCVFFVCLYLRWTGGFVEHFERNAKAYQSSWEQAYFSQNTPYDRFYQCGCFSHQQENNLRPVSSNGVSVTAEARARCTV